MRQRHKSRRPPADFPISPEQIPAAPGRIFEHTVVRPQIAPPEADQVRGGFLPLCHPVHGPGKTVYDADLGFGMGHIAGYFVPESKMGGVQKALSALYDALPKGEGDPMLYAMGDGNHSFATAKAHWENVKKTLTPEQQATHPARFALCELVNIHDDSLLFEPIHRALFQVPGEAVQELAEAMERMLRDQELRNTCISRGLERVKRFTWEKAAEDVYQIYQELGR